MTLVALLRKQSAGSATYKPRVLFMPVFSPTIFEYVTTEETSYKTKEIQVGENWQWNMSQHISLSFHMKHGKYLNISNDPKTKPPFHNIIMPILEFRYSAEDRDVKDIIFETEEPSKQHLSFLIKKYWDDVYTIENNIDEFIDDAIEEKVDYGGCLVKKGTDVPESVPLQNIAFCDQTDMLGAPIGFKFNFSPESLKRKAKLGWGDKKKGASHTIEEVITLATKDKETSAPSNTESNQSTGKNIEVYVVRGTLPESYLNDKGDTEKLIDQVQVIGFYRDKIGKQGVILYKAPEKEKVFKVHIPKKIFQRALGWGGVEALIDPQIWTNFAEIHKNNFLKSSSKSIIYTDDDNYANRSKIRDLENDEVTVIDRESRFGLRRLEPPVANIALFNNRVQELEAHAQRLAGVSDALLGKQPPAGTPFRLQERVVFEGKKPHERTAGKFDKFLEEIINDWVIPHIVRKITAGTEFLSNLTSEEMEYVMQKVPRNRAAKRQIEDILSGIIPKDLAIYEEEERQTILQNGNRQILKILKDEFKNVKLSVKIRVSQKQKDLSAFVDNLVKVLQQYMANPQMRNDPTATHILSQILEASGFSAASLGGLTMPVEPAPQMGGGEEMALPAIKGLTKGEAVLA